MTIVLGDFSAERKEALRLAVLRGNSEPTFVRHVEEARTHLGKGDRPTPRCVVLDGAAPGIEAFVEWMRGEARLFSVPIIVGVPALDEAAFCESHAFGADDVVVTADDEAVTRRVANLAALDPESRPPITQGRAIVCHPEMGRRRVLGRILRQAGFDVSFAADAEELVSVAGQGQAPSLIVTAQPPGDRGALWAVEQVRAERPGFLVPFVVLGAANDVRDMGKQADGVGAVAVMSEHAPPDNLLFLANELMRPDVMNVRASARLLYGALCAFRPEGELVPTYGLTYNVSREGMYVRTLDAPASGTEIWLELRPPRADKVVHLAATVVWRRGLTSAAGGASPPGFGARVLPESCGVKSLKGYCEGYERLRAEPRLFA